jgi:hypothetical protein
VFKFEIEVEEEYIDRNKEKAIRSRKAWATATTSEEDKPAIIKFIEALDTDNQVGKITHTSGTGLTTRRGYRNTIIIKSEKKRQLELQKNKTIEEGKARYKRHRGTQLSETFFDSGNQLICNLKGAEDTLEQEDLINLEHILDDNTNAGFNLWFPSARIEEEYERVIRHKSNPVNTWIHCTDIKYRQVSHWDRKRKQQTPSLYTIKGQETFSRPSDKQKEVLNIGKGLGWIKQTALKDWSIEKQVFCLEKLSQVTNNKWTVIEDLVRSIRFITPDRNLGGNKKHIIIWLKKFVPKEILNLRIVRKAEPLDRRLSTKNHSELINLWYTLEICSPNLFVNLQSHATRRVNTVIQDYNQKLRSLTYNFVQEHIEILSCFDIYVLETGISAFQQFLFKYLGVQADSFDTQTLINTELHQSIENIFISPLEETYCTFDYLDKIFDCTEEEIEDNYFQFRIASREQGGQDTFYFNQPGSTEENTKHINPYYISPEGRAFDSTDDITRARRYIEPPIPIEQRKNIWNKIKSGEKYNLTFVKDKQTADSNPFTNNTDPYHNLN